jgi:hypothetical protein
VNAGGFKRFGSLLMEKAVYTIFFASMTILHHETLFRKFVPALIETAMNLKKIASRAACNF